MAWADIETIRNISGISTDTFSDGDVQEFIESAQKEVNSKVCQTVIREYVEYIDQTRKNDINGSNTRFYVKNWKGNYLGDYDYDGDIDTSDIKVYSVASDGTETELVPSSISIPNCYFNLTSAPTNVKLYVSYSYLSFNPVEPDARLEQAVTYLAASYIYVGDDADSIKFGNVSLSSGSKNLYNQYYEKYLNLINQLLENSTGGAIWGESKVQI